jgi:hypothetical protein
LALEILQRLDGRIGADGPDEFRDGQHVVADDLQRRALLDCQDSAGEIDLAIGQAALEQIADCRAAAI